MKNSVNKKSQIQELLMLFNILMCLT